ncbi:hypothetical protein DRX00_12085 [Salmonella enterica subsp. enterica serovar Gatuni]|nr:hypothetical protein [Salmonella enterica subsp. enterica serovar Gatuni]
MAEETIMHLSQIERDKIITALEKEWKHMFQAGFATPLVSRLQEATAYHSNSPYYGTPNSLETRMRIERELSTILEQWCDETASKYVHVAHKLLDKDLFWLTVEEGEDRNSIEIKLSPTILELYNGVSPINVFNWTSWSDAMLKNAYGDLVKKERT